LRFGFGEQFINQKLFLPLRRYNKGIFVDLVKTIKQLADKSGIQLWGENCARCHNAPGPGEFNNDNREIVGLHMRVRANLIQTDMDKIVDFLKSTNN
jgi:hypothetical protein